MILASGMAVIDSSALNIALPSLQKALNASGVQLVWVVNAYALMLAAFILTGGSLGDLYGRKRTMLGGMVLFILASGLCGCSTGILFLIAARGLQGIGAAFMIPGSLAILSASFDDQTRGKAIGVWSAAGAMLVVLGPVLGGILTGMGVWRCIFFINLPIGLAAFLIIRAKVPESYNQHRKGPEKPDAGGAALIFAGLGLLTYGLTAWSAQGAGKTTAGITIAAGIAFLFLFILNESRVSSAMMPLHLFRSQTFTGANLLTLFLYGALTVSTFFLSINLVQIQGYSSPEAGFSFLAFPLPLVLFSGFAGSLADRYGSKWLLVSGPVLTGCSFYLLSRQGLTAGPSSYFTTFFPSLLLMGTGMALTVAPLTTTVMSSARTDLSGTASGINNAVTRIASVLALALFSSLAIQLLEKNMALETRTFALSKEIRQTYKAEAARLGAARIPAHIPLLLKAKMSDAFKRAFTDTYAVIMQIAAVLCLISGLIALFLINNGNGYT